MNTVTYNSRSYEINGRRIWLTCGEMHYFRVHRGLWSKRFRQAKQAGLNCISTYMAWNLHESEEGVFDFSGELDVQEYIKLAAEEGLYVILRPGPYICSEWDYGGLPAWLNNKSNLIIRTYNEQFRACYEKYFNKILPCLAEMDVVHGGNIILIQNENEHHMPAVPGRLEYFKDITRIFRECGFMIPVINCNRIFEGDIGSGTIECVNTWDDPIGDFKRLKAVQPDAPLLVTEFWCGGLDGWGHPHSLKDPLKVMNKALEIIGGGGQITYYMWHGGTNFGFMGGRLQYDDHFHIPTSYDLDAPLGESGQLTEKYYKTRLVNMMSNSFGDSLAACTDAEDVSVDETEMIIRSEGEKGTWTLIKALKDSAERSIGESILLPSRLILNGTTILDHTNSMPLGFFMKKYLVLHTLAGSEAIFSVNGTEYKCTVSEKHFTLDGAPSVSLIELENITVIITSDYVATRIWNCGQQLLIGPAYADPDGRDIMSSGQEDRYLIITTNSIVSAPYKDPVAQNGCCRKLVWKDKEITSKTGEWVQIDSPESAEKLGIPYGYLWYKAECEIDEAIMVNLHIPYCADRLRIYLNGKFQAVWGTGENAVSSFVPIKLNKGFNTLVFLSDNMGRYCHSWRMGDLKGIFGPMYHAEELSLKPAASISKREFHSSMIVSKKGHLNEDDHIESLINNFHRTIGYTFTLEKCMPIHLKASVKNDILLIVNDIVVEFFDIPGSGFIDHIIPKEYLNVGKNVVEFIIWSREEKSLSDVIAFSLCSNRIPEFKWFWKRWGESDSYIAGIEDPPAWYESFFDSVDSEESAYSKCTFINFPPGIKGQLYCNGYNIGRVWSILPQDTYYIPETLIKRTDNKLRFFSESGQSPEDSTLTDKFEWARVDNVDSQPDVL